MLAGEEWVANSEARDAVGNLIDVVGGEFPSVTETMVPQVMQRGTSYFMDESITGSGHF